MKILHNKDGKLQWKEADWNGRCYTVNDNNIAQTEVIAVKGLPSNKYVKCTHCGTIIRNTPAEIAKHKRRGTSSEICFSCKYCNTSDTCIKSEKYTKLDNGKYVITKKTESKLICKRQYGRSPEIDSEGARLGCMYSGCVTTSYPVLKDFFHIYPNAFDELITVDKILKNGYRQRASYGSETQYTLKARNTIVAHVNKQNIVVAFTIFYKDVNAKVMYSPKYDKLFSCSHVNYAEWNPSSYYWPDDVQERIKNKIASLYN